MDKYKIVNGTSYHTETDNKIISLLEQARINRVRLRLYFGDVETGKDWVSEHEIIGYIGRSTGTIKIPILVYNERSFGGIGVLDHCIVKIKESKGCKVLYQHKNYIAPTFEIKESDLSEYSHELIVNGELYSRHKTQKDALTLQKRLS